MGAKQSVENDIHDDPVAGAADVDNQSNTTTKTTKKGKKCEDWSNFSGPVRNLVLYGPGNSAKTTIAKQISNIYGGERINDEALLEQIVTQIIHYLKTVIEYIITNHSNEYIFTLSNDEAVQWITKLPKLVHVDEDVKQPTTMQERNETDSYFYLYKEPTTLKYMTELWCDPAVNECHQLHRSQMKEITDGGLRLSRKLDEILSLKNKYTPTYSDWLCVGGPTVGNVETVFNFNNTGVEYKVIDIGGEDDERKQWDQCCEQYAPAIPVIIVSLGNYDQTCRYNDKLNKWDESTSLAKLISNSNCMIASHKMCILFTRGDELRRKLPTAPFVNFHPEYTQDNSFESVHDYMTNQIKRFIPEQIRCQCFDVDTFDRDDVQRVMDEILRDMPVL